MIFTLSVTMPSDNSVTLTMKQELELNEEEQHLEVSIMDINTLKDIPNDVIIDEDDNFGSSLES